MNKLFTACCLSILAAISAFGQGIVRYSPTTNGAVANASLANNHVLTYMSPPGIWTNKPVIATATNAIADMSGLGTNTTIRGLTSTIGMTNTGTFSNSSHAYIGGSLYSVGLTNAGPFTNASHAYVGGSAVIHGGITNKGVTRMESTVTNLADVGIGGNTVISGQLVVGDLSSFGSDVTILGSSTFTLNSLTASTVVMADGSKNIVSIANGTGMLTNNGSGTVGWMAIPAAGAGATNNAVMANNYEQVGSIEITNNIINYWHAGVPGPVATTNWLYATNGDSQFYNLFSHTNMQYVPLSGAYASNHLGVAVAFTQNSTGGYYPTNNGLLIPVRTNANASTMVYFSIANGATNVTVAYPFSMGPAANLDIIEFDVASGTWTNKATANLGLVLRQTNNVETSFSGAAYFNAAIDSRNLFNASTMVVTQNVRTLIHLPAITTSNLLVSFSTNNTECVGLTNIILTNIVEETTGVNAKTKVVIRNTLGVSVPVLLPAFGAQHGYYFHTNGFNDILTATVAPPGTNTVFSFEIDGTNVYPTVTYWRHP